LSEVLADASNRLGYVFDAASKRLSWRTEILLKEKGIDSFEIQEKFDEIDRI